MQEWFRHDFNAPEDPKLIALQRARGYDGIGIFWTLMAVIGRAENRSWPRAEIPELAFALRLDEEQLKSDITLFVRLHLLVDEDGILYSRGMRSRMDELDGLRARRKEAGQKAANSRWNRPENANRNANALRPLNMPDAIAIQSRVEKSRVEGEKNGESPRVKVISSIPPSKTELLQYATGIQDGTIPFDNSARSQAIKSAGEFLDYYTANGWKVGRNKMKDWQATFRNWLRRNGEFRANGHSKPVTNAPGEGLVW